MEAAEPATPPAERPRPSATSYAIHAKRAESSTAACIAGELRAGIVPRVFERIRINAFEPLAADAFLVTSRRWSISYHNSSKYGAGWQNLPEEVSVENQTALVAALRPVGHLLVGSDVEFAEWLQTDSSIARAVAADLAIEQARPANVSLLHAACRAWPLGEECVGANSVAMLGGYTMAALRWRTCLAMIEVAERRAGGSAHHTKATAAAAEQYNWVLRVRPDLALTCRMSFGFDARRTAAEVSLPANTSRHTNFWFFFDFDFLMLMPRRAADVALRVLPLASAHPAATALTCRGGGQQQLCAHCLLKNYGYKGFQLHHSNFPMLSVARYCTQIRYERLQHAPCTEMTGGIGMSPPSKDVACQPFAAVAQDACVHMHDTWLVSMCRCSSQADLVGSHRQHWPGSPWTVDNATPPTPLWA